MCQRCAKNSLNIWVLRGISWCVLCVLGRGPVAIWEKSCQFWFPASHSCIFEF